jgi:hypothetical protein
MATLPRVEFEPQQVASVAFVGSIRTGEVTGAGPQRPFRNGYSPVSSAYREGVQTDEAECAPVNRRPSLARRSMSGVFTFVAS